MKTGLGGVPNVPDNFLRRALSIVAAMMVEAANAAATYASHAQRTVVHKEDLHLALQLQARTFLYRENLEQEVEEIERHLFGSDSNDDDGDDDTESSGRGEDTLDEGDLKWTESKCTCKTCSDMHAFRDSWDEWAPTDALEQHIKRLVTETLRETA